MKAVVLKGIGVLEVTDIPEPEPVLDEIKVKIAYAGICGTDPKIVEGKVGYGKNPDGSIGEPMKGPQMRNGVSILGHEASGTIVKLGKDVAGNFRIGQKVAINFRNTCGACYYCTNGMENFCERATISGTMAEYNVFKEGLVFPLPDDLPLDCGALLEPLTIALHTLDIAQIKLGDSVIITGGGPIGLLILQLAVRSGAAKILVSEPMAEKRELAKRFGADVTVDPLTEDLLAISNKLTDGRGFNVCIEASGIPSVARQLILLAERSGTVVWAGVYPNVDVGVPIFYMYSKELSIKSVKVAPYSYPRSAAMLPKLDLKPLIKVYPLADVVEAFAAHKTSKYTKILLQP